MHRTSWMSWNLRPAGLAMSDRRLSDLHQPA
jgi:hypothetical protein